MKKVIKICLFFLVLFLPFVVNAKDNKEITLHLFPNFIHNKTSPTPNSTYFYYFHTSLLKLKDSIFSLNTSTKVSISSLVVK